MPEFSARYEIAFSARVCVVVGWGNLWQFPLYAGVAKYSRERFRLKKRKNADKTRRFFGGRGGGMIGGRFGGLWCFQRLISGLERIFFFWGSPVFFTCAMEIFGEVANRRRRRKSSFPNSVFIVFVPNRGAALMPGSRCVCSQGIAELRVSSLDKVVLLGRVKIPLLFCKLCLAFRVAVSVSREAADCPFPLFAVRPPQTRGLLHRFPLGAETFLTKPSIAGV